MCINSNNCCGTCHAEVTERVRQLANDYNRLLLTQTDKVPEDGNEIDDEILEVELDEQEKAYYKSDR